MTDARKDENSLLVSVHFNIICMRHPRCFKTNYDAHNCIIYTQFVLHENAVVDFIFINLPIQNRKYVRHEMEIILAV